MDKATDAAQEECAILESIYGDLFSYLPVEEDSFHLVIFQDNFSLFAKFPLDYPDSSPPHIEVHCELRKDIVQEMFKVYICIRRLG